MLPEHDEIRAACRAIVYLLDSRERWDELATIRPRQKWQVEFHQEAVKLRKLLSDHEKKECTWPKCNCIESLSGRSCRALKQTQVRGPVVVLPLNVAEQISLMLHRVDDAYSFNIEQDKAWLALTDAIVSASDREQF